MVMAGPTEAGVKERLLAREAQLEGYQESERERLQTLAGLDLELHGEIPSPYLSAKVKIRKNKTVIKEVQYKGERFYGSQEVLRAASDHFRESFSEQTGTERQEGGTVEVATSLPGDAAARLCAPWTERGVKEALAGLPRGKSPGRDGLPPELFRAHWDLLGGPLIEFAKRFERTGHLDEALSTAVTVLLHKKGPTDQLGNYRPITLLSTIYKVLAKVLANRLKKELHLVISEDQHGFVSGRSLAEAVSVVADAVEAADNGGEDWFLLMVDFQKAYDTVARPYLFETMRKRGIPDEFVRWTEGLHHGSGTSVVINGWVRERVEMKKGVRQGCPLAPYLFLCALEPLYLEVKKQGLGVKEKEGTAELAYVGYADDTTLILKGEEQLRSAAEALEQFGRISGLRTNNDKSVVMPIGRNKGRQSVEGVPFKWAEAGVRIDNMAVKMVGKMLAEKNATKKWLAEKAAALPQGEATFFADPSAGKHWPGGNQRWKAAVEAFWDSPYAVLPEPSCGWEVEQECLCFNRRIMFRGKSPYGNQQGTEDLRKKKIGDLVSGGPGAERKVKSKETLREELGGVAVARWALMAYAATSEEWKKLAIAGKTAEKLVEVAGVVRTFLPRTQEHLYWKVSGAKEEKVTVSSAELTREAKIEEWAELVKASFRPEYVEPIATRGGRVLGVVGAPAVRLKLSKLFDDDGALSRIKAIRRVLAGPTTASRKRSEWEERWGRKIDWRKVESRRDSMVIPNRARDVLLMMHCLNLQVGGRLKFLGERARCSHCGEPETLEHCMFSCPLVQPVIGALLRSLRMLDPSSNPDSLGALLFEEGQTRSGFTSATLVATTFRHIWLASNVVWRGETFQRKKVARGAIREFVQHAQVYRTELTRKARRKGTAQQGIDPWRDLKGDERAAVTLLSELGGKATWSDGFLSIWRNPRTIRQPP
ncbi:unnamed protein product [Closterium sp. NIES-65]|nr:unnamed protein product [Closterium sp. NIES-65]